MRSHHGTVASVWGPVVTVQLADLLRDNKTDSDQISVRFLIFGFNPESCTGPFLRTHTHKAQYQNQPVPIIMSQSKPYHFYRWHSFLWVTCWYRPGAQLCSAYFPVSFVQCEIFQCWHTPSSGMNQVWHWDRNHLINVQSLSCTHENCPMTAPVDGKYLWGTECNVNQTKPEHISQQCGNVLAFYVK